MSCTSIYLFYITKIYHEVIVLNINFIIIEIYKVIFNYVSCTNILIFTIPILSYKTNTLSIYNFY